MTDFPDVLKISSLLSPLCVLVLPLPRWKNSCALYSFLAPGVASLSAGLPLALPLSHGSSTSHSSLRSSLSNCSSTSISPPAWRTRLPLMCLLVSY